MSKPIPKNVTIQTDSGPVTVPCKRVPGTDEFTCTPPGGEELRLKVDRKTSKVTFISKEGSQTVQGKPLPNVAEITATSPTGEKIGLMIIDPSIFPGKYTAEDLLHIKKRQLPLYDLWKCVCHESNYKEVSEIVEPSFCLKMGPDFENFMNSLKS